MVSINDATLLIEAGRVRLVVSTSARADVVIECASNGRTNLRSLHKCGDQDHDDFAMHWEHYSFHDLRL
jgi:hypothetical protein